MKGKNAMRILQMTKAAGRNLKPMQQAREATKKARKSSDEGHGKKHAKFRTKGMGKSPETTETKIERTVDPAKERQNFCESLMKARKRHTKSRQRPAKGLQKIRQKPVKNL
ncbi:MAG: hypothetical protein K6F52_04210 [Clostridia bacterium]|nr:hypothetical protein [Clostridia bacterium]